MLQLNISNVAKVTLLTQHNFPSLHLTLTHTLFLSHRDSPPRMASEQQLDAIKVTPPLNLVTAWRALLSSSQNSRVSCFDLVCSTAVA